MATSTRYANSTQVDPGVATNIAGTLSGSWAADLDSNATINSVTIYVELTGSGFVDDTWDIVSADAEYASTSQASISVSGSGYLNSTQTWGPTADNTGGADSYRIDELDIDISYSQSKGPDNGIVTLTTNSYVTVDYTPNVPTGPVVKVYNGSTWDTGVPKVYNGSTWDVGSAKVYNGSSF